MDSARVLNAVERKRTNIRLSVQALRLMAELAKSLGVGKSHVIELAVRDMAKKEGVKQ